MTKNMPVIPLESHTTSTFWRHVFSEISGTPSLEEFDKVGFVDAGGNVIDTVSKSSINMSIYPANYLHVNGTYTPSKSYTLAYIYLIGKAGDPYIVFDVSDRVVNPGDNITFYLNYQLSTTVIQTTGFLSKFTYDLTSSMDRLISLILYVFAYGRDNVDPSGVSLKPAYVKVFASDGQTVMASTSNVTVTPDISNTYITIQTDQFKVTNAPNNSDYISKIQFIDSLNKRVLIEMNKVDYEYVSNNHYIQITLTLSHG
jgi:hypothetical protein